MVIARTMVLSRDGKILVLRRSLDDEHAPGRVDFPGGKVEPGEALTAAAVRETQEESGITLSERNLSLEYAFSVYDSKSDAVMTRLLFMARTETDTVQLSREHIAYWWRSFSEVSELFAETSWRDALQFVGQYRFDDSAG